jgi:hypothetical protein
VKAIQQKNQKLSIQLQLSNNALASTLIGLDRSSQDATLMAQHLNSDAVLKNMRFDAHRLATNANGANFTNHQATIVDKYKKKRKLISSSSFASMNFETKEMDVIVAATNKRQKRSLSPLSQKKVQSSVNNNHSFLPSRRVEPFRRISCSENASQSRLTSLKSTSQVRIPRSKGVSSSV